MAPRLPRLSFLRLRARDRLVILPILLISLVSLLWALTHPYTLKTTLSYITRPAWDTLIYPNSPIINLASPALFSSHANDPSYICSLHNGSAPRHQPAKIWDAIIFSHELDMLEIHLAELYPVVDKFIILESTVTYSGTPKALHYRENQHRYERFADKIVYTIFSDSDTDHFSFTPGDFAIETQQRGAMTGVIDDLYRQEREGSDSLSSTNRQDILVLISDVDEIPYAHTLELVKTCALPPVLHLQLIPYVYSFEWISGDLDSWHIQIHTWIPGTSYYKHSSKSTDDYITAAGVHCSFCFPKIGDFVWKMRAYSHNDRLGDHPKALLRPERIQRAVCKGENIFGMLPEAYTWWDLISRWEGHSSRRQTAIEAPKLVQAQPERFHYLLPGGCERPIE